jgi:hypothetical protein
MINKLFKRKMKFNKIIKYSEINENKLFFKIYFIIFWNFSNNKYLKKKLIRWINKFGKLY